MGRGSSGKVVNGASKDGSLLAVNPRQIETTHFLYGSRSGNSYRDTVLEATTDENGNLTFSYATPVNRSGPSAKTNKTESVTYELRHGAINGRTFGIDWAKVQSISGQTYDLRDEAKRAGLSWDSQKKIWRRK